MINPNPILFKKQKMQQPKAIHSQRCWVDGHLQEATIYFEAGIITNIIPGPLSGSDNNVTDFGSAVIMPGAIDAHVHINEPGRTDWEGFETATTAAATGGVTTMVDMPLNSSPVTTNVAAFQQKLAAAKDKLQVNCGFYGGLIPGNVGELQGLIQQGVLGIKAFLVHSGIDEFPNVGKKELEAAMPIIAKYKIPILAHCEMINGVPEKAPDKSSPGSYQQYLASRPKKWENDAVKLMIELCERYDCPTHIVHVSSAEALADIAKAKAKGLPLTAETCPHYIYFQAETIPDNNTLFKCAPPIRGQKNNQQLKDALISGVLDFIATDHSPAPPALKELVSGDLIKAWGGISGLQYLVSAAWTSLQNDLPLEKFIPLLTENPAKYLHINHEKGYLKRDFHADFTVWSPEESFFVAKAENQHRHQISPYIGERLSGKIIATYVNGIAVFDQKIINKNIGKCIIKKRE
ncbi:MAG: allantoinase [Saprospiraceae bacterium]|nr:MAG: allantoinase [Saprospiraceae bacterium]